MYGSRVCVWAWVCCCVCVVPVFVCIQFCMKMSDRFAQSFQALICKSGILKVYDDKWSFCHRSQRDVTAFAIRRYKLCSPDNVKFFCFYAVSISCQQINLSVPLHCETRNDLFSSIEHVISNNHTHIHIYIWQRNKTARKSKSSVKTKASRTKPWFHIYVQCTKSAISFNFITYIFFYYFRTIYFITVLKGFSFVYVYLRALEWESRNKSKNPSKLYFLFDVMGSLLTSH